MDNRQHTISAIIKIVSFFALMIISGFILQDIYSLG